MNLVSPRKYPALCYYPLKLPYCMANARSIPDLKDEVREFWDSDPCGSRYLEGQEDFAAHARARYELEPHIPGFAQFAASRGLRVLEIGVGMGADYLEWLKAGAHATGVDLSSARWSVRAGGVNWPDSGRTCSTRTPNTYPFQPTRSTLCIPTA